MFMAPPQLWFICERLRACLLRAQTNRWVCVWQWKDNPNLSEAQVQGMALARQATISMELKRREAMYRDVLSKQQTVISFIYCLILSPVTCTLHSLVLLVLNLGNIQLLEAGQLFTSDIAESISHQYDYCLDKGPGRFVVKSNGWV